MKHIKPITDLFNLAIKDGLLKFEIEIERFDHSEHPKGWLNVYYQENLGYMPSTDGSCWRLLCAQSLHDYFRGEELQTTKLANRITLMLAESLRSARQDVNGLMAERK